MNKAQKKINENKLEKALFGKESKIEGNHNIMFLIFDIHDLSLDTKNPDNLLKANFKTKYILFGNFQIHKFYNHYKDCQFISIFDVTNDSL